jgi:hypothetical protein
MERRPGLVVKNAPMVRASVAALKRLGVTKRSPHRNLYHACTQKTASQWFRQLFTNAAVFDYTGLRVVPYTGLEDAGGIGLRYATITKPFPRNSVGAHLYVDRSTYDAIPKPGSYKTFFVMRDPRDIVVSWYFHARSPRTENKGPIPLLRRAIENRSFEDGMRSVIDEVNAWGTFDAAVSWLQADPDPRVAVYRYEDLVADNRSFVTQLFAHLDIAMPAETVDDLVERFAFERLSGGRRPGDEDSDAHLRKGVAGDWRNHFTPTLAEYFQEVTSDVTGTLDYAS